MRYDRMERDDSIVIASYILAGASDTLSEAALKAISGSSAVLIGVAYCDSPPKLAAFIPAGVLRWDLQLYLLSTAVQRNSAFFWPSPSVTPIALVQTRCPYPLSLKRFNDPPSIQRKLQGAAASRLQRSTAAHGVHVPRCQRKLVSRYVRTRQRPLHQPRKTAILRTASNGSIHRQLKRKTGSSHCVMGTRSQKGVAAGWRLYSRRMESCSDGYRGLA